MKESTNKHRTLLSALVVCLRDISKGNISEEYEDHGLCHIVEEEFACELEEDIFVDWEHWSGKFCYPVPHKDGAREGFLYTSGNMYEGKYGVLRMHLAGYLATFIEEDFDRALGLIYSCFSGNTLRSTYEDSTSEKES